LLSVLAMPPLVSLRIDGPSGETLSFSKSRPKRTLRLTNVSAGFMAYKVKTTAPKCYVVSPAVGVLVPNGHEEVAIICLPATTDEPLSTILAAIQGHRFLFLATSVPSAEPITREHELWQKCAKESLQERRLTVAVVSCDGSASSSSAGVDPMVSHSSWTKESTAENGLCQLLGAIADEEASSSGGAASAFLTSRGEKTVSASKALELPMTLLRIGVSDAEGGAPSGALWFNTAEGRRSRTLILTNNSDGFVAFKLKTTAPKSYRVSPALGTLDPGAQLQVEILLVGPGQLASEPRHRFLIQAIPVVSSQQVLPAQWNEVPKERIQGFRINVEALEVVEAQESGMSTEALTGPAEEDMPSEAFSSNEDEELATSHHSENPPGQQERQEREQPAAIPFSCASLPGLQSLPPPAENQAERWDSSSGESGGESPRSNADSSDAEPEQQRGAEAESSNPVLTSHAAPPYAESGQQNLTEPGGPAPSLVLDGDSTLAQGVQQHQEETEILESLSAGVVVALPDLVTVIFKKDDKKLGLKIDWVQPPMVIGIQPGSRGMKSDPPLEQGARLLEANDVDVSCMPPADVRDLLLARPLRLVFRGRDAPADEPLSDGSGSAADPGAAAVSADSSAARQQEATPSKPAFAASSLPLSPALPCHPVEGADEAKPEEKGEETEEETEEETDDEEQDAQGATFCFSPDAREVPAPLSEQQSAYSAPLSCPSLPPPP